MVEWKKIYHSTLFSISSFNGIIRYNLLYTFIWITKSKFNLLDLKIETQTLSLRIYKSNKTLCYENTKKNQQENCANQFNLLHLLYGGLPKLRGSSKRLDLQWMWCFLSIFQVGFIRLLCRHFWLQCSFGKRMCLLPLIWESGGHDQFVHAHYF